ncbi:uncharacterized protein LOC124287567 [Haliotis rubra]|uniref:uncharacterized protein LOC124287567 n=1 Tax=Haliotis rubra TaxID=36100 RepID=UPI001EE60D02|nr:uncharacterized protein LOC124287567 [Haliotis rubra]
MDLDLEQLHHRSVHHQISTETESDVSESEDEDDRRQVVDTSSEEEEKLVDPGPFRYHKRICAAALPCFLIVIGFVGEFMLTMMTVGTVLLILLDRMGERRRSVIIYTLFFIPCHILVFVSVLPLIWLSLWNVFLIGAINAYVILTGGWIILLFPAFRTEEPVLAQVGKRSVIIYTLFFIPCHILVFVSVLPLIWLSLWNVFLIGAINAYVILTGGWIILLFPAFRTEEPVLAQMIEQLLFSAYPAVCSVLVTWTLTTITPTSMAPLIVMATSFVFIKPSVPDNHPAVSSFIMVSLSLKATPAVSSFRLKATAEEDLNVLQQPIVLVMALSFCFLPSMLHVILCITSSSTDSILSQRSLLELGLVVSLSLFLATLLSVRQLFEYAGYPYTIVTRGRWVCGMLATVLCYPVLQQYQLSSHFLPWLPIAIVTFAVLGFLLGIKKYWVNPGCGAVGLSGCPAGLLDGCVTMASHLLSAAQCSPQLFYVVLSGNFAVCLLCMYIGSHGNKELFGFLLCLQSVLLTVCETALHDAGLYSVSLCVMTTVLATYMLQRLHHSDKVWLGSVLFSSSVHITKGVSCLLTELVLKDKLGLLNHAGLFLLTYAILQSFVYEPREAVPLNEAARNLVFLLVSLALNTFPVLTVLCYNLWQDIPTYTDLIGMWALVGGLLVLLFAQVHSEVVSEIHLTGLLMSMVGGVILALQPQFQLSMLPVKEILLVVMVILTTSCGVTVPLASGLLRIVPSVRTVFMLYGDFPSAVHIPLYLVQSAAIITVLILYSKADTIHQQTDNIVMGSCILSAVSMAIVFGLDLAVLQTKVTTSSLPVLKGMMGTTVCLSILMKLLAAKQGPDFIPVASHTKDTKEKPRLPLVSNIVTIAAFPLLCLQGPTEGFLHDMWCCGASLIFFCLHRDFQFLISLRDHNHRTPTILSSIAVLVLASVYRSSLWQGDVVNILWGCSEIIFLIGTFPVYIVLWGVLWKNEIISENMVVFTMPLNGFMYLVGTTYSIWAVATYGLLAGTWMMVYKLPMVPYAMQYQPS